MKYSIHGFYQPRAVELGLTNDDLLVLRWFVDFAGTNKMKTIIEEDGIYYWVNYTSILEDLPVLRISKVTLKRKHFDKLCEANVLKHKHIKQGGSFSYYAYGINYDTLIYLQDNNPSTELDYPSTKLDKGYDEIGLPPSTKLDYPYDENVQTKINLLNNQSINNQSIIDNNIPYQEIIEHLNNRVGTNYKHTTKKTRDLIKARFNEGFTIDDFKIVIDKKCVEWINDEKMNKFLRPETLFGTKFESYLNQVVQQKKITTKDLKIDISDF